MFLYIFWGLVLVAFLFLYLIYYGLFNPIIIHEIEYGPIDFFYLDYKGHYRHVGRTFDKIKRAAARIFKNGVQIMGIYYDDPKDVEDPYESRSALGFFPPEDTTFEMKCKFKETNGVGLEFKQLPYIQALHVRFPYKSFLTFYVMGYRVYAKMYEYLKRRNLAVVNGIIEEYHFKNGYIDIILPYGERSEEFRLTKIKRPKYHIDKKDE